MLDNGAIATDQLLTRLAVQLQNLSLMLRTVAWTLKRFQGIGISLVEGDKLMCTEVYLALVGFAAEIAQKSVAGGAVRGSGISLGAHIARYGARAFRLRLL